MCDDINDPETFEIETFDIESLDKTLPAQKVGEVYLHVGNSGVTFTVLDDPKLGPVVEVSTSSFGNIPTVTRVFTTDQGLEALAKLFVIACKRGYHKPYCFPAYTNGDYSEGKDDQGNPVLTVTEGPGLPFRRPVDSGHTEDRQE